MIDTMRKVLTPNLARVITSLAAVCAICSAGIVTYTMVKGQVPDLRHFSGPYSELNSVGGDRRLVRMAQRGNARIVCSEGPRQLQFISDTSNGGKGSSPATASPPAALSTVFVREAGWQLCNAYANGVISQAEYVELLKSLISGPTQQGRSQSEPTQSCAYRQQVGNRLSEKGHLRRQLVKRTTNLQAKTCKMHGTEYPVIAGAAG